MDKAEGEREGEEEVVGPDKEVEEAAEREEAYVEGGEVELAVVAAVKVAEERRTFQTETTSALLALGTMRTTLMCKTLDSSLRERERESREHTFLTTFSRPGRLTYSVFLHPSCHPKHCQLRQHLCCHAHFE